MAVMCLAIASVPLHALSHGQANEGSLAPEWRQLPAGQPRFAHVGFLDEGANRLIVTGGRAGVVELPAGGSVLDLGAGGTWEPFEPAGTPPAPRGHGLVGGAGVTDSSEGAAVLVCDCVNGAGHELRLEEPEWVRSVDGEAGAQAHGALVYDRSGDRAFFIGGGRASEITPTLASWFYDLSAAREGWLAGPALPAPRAFHAAGIRGTVVYVFGGQDETTAAQDELWRIDLSAANPQWSEVAPEGAWPAARMGATLTFDPATGLGFLIGGYTAGSDKADTWLLVESPLGEVEWTELEVRGRVPDGRSAHSAVWDPAGRRVIVHGGIQGEAAIVRGLADTWAFYPYGAPPAENAYSIHLPALRTGELPLGAQ
jgi:hypothetical protein